MQQIGSAKGHTVFVRCVTSPETWEAACDCSYRSPRYHSKVDATQSAEAHLENAEAVKKKPARKKARRR